MLVGATHRHTEQSAALSAAVDQLLDAQTQSAVSTGEAISDKSQRRTVECQLEAAQATISKLQKANQDLQEDAAAHRRLRDKLRFRLEVTRETGKDRGPEIPVPDR